MMLGAPCTAAALDVRDDAGSELRLARPARRIVSLAPHVTELLYAAGAGSRLVATVEYSDYPPQAATLPSVGSAARLDLERIAALAPDLVIGWASGNPAGQLERLRRLGLPLFLSEPRRLEDIARNLEMFGRLAGSEAAADAAAAAFRSRLATLTRNYAQRPAVRVFYEIWDQPLVTINGRQIISDVLRLCGGENVFAALPVLAPAVAIEAVLAADPEAIIASGASAERPAWLDAWMRWPALTAAARGNLFAVDADLMQRQTPRLLDGAGQVCADLEAARARRPR
jgi:iron complex transport system substrate-binding protein